MKLIASILCPLLAPAVAAITIGPPTSTTTTTDATTSWPESTWNPFKCGDCGCCCKPAHKLECWSVDAMECKHGDFQLWNNVSYKVHEGIEEKKLSAASVDECVKLCSENSNFCEAIAFKDFECTLLSVLHVWDGEDAKDADTIGMLCNHEPHEYPETLPDEYRWTSCAAHLAEASKDMMPGKSIPQCTNDGSYKNEQCHGSTGYCHCVNEFGAMIDGSEVFGPANCKKTENTVLDCAWFDVSGPGDKGEMKCENGAQVYVTEAIYGRQSSSKCSAGNGEYESWRYDVCASTLDVTDRLKAQCDGKTSCQSQLYGKIEEDPCVGTHKYVEIKYTCKRKAQSKLDRLVESTASIIKANLKRPLPVTKRLYRTAAKMSEFLQKTLENCGEIKDDVDDEPTRSDIEQSLCDDFPRYVSRLKKFVAAYNSSCDVDGAPNKVRRVQKQLDQLSKRATRNRC